MRKRAAAEIRPATSTTPKLPRHESERIRRMNMKDLYAKLAFVVPTPPFKSSLPVLLERAAAHIKDLQEKLDIMKQKKLQLEGRSGDHQGTGSSRSAAPEILVREVDSNLEVLLVSGLNKSFFLYEVIEVLEEEAARVVTVDQSTAGDKIIYRIFSQAVSSRIGIETTRVHRRLEELIS